MVTKYFVGCWGEIVLWGIKLRIEQIYQQTMSLPIQYTPSTITLVVLDSLMGKCEKMLFACAVIDIKNFQEEYERQLEAQESFYLEDNQLEYERRWTEAYDNFDAEIDAIIASQPGHDTILTGDSALDAEEEEEIDYCSDMDDCLIETFEYNSGDIDEILPTIDFSEEINLNELYQ